jgi:hypothetical protein
MAIALTACGGGGNSNHFNSREAANAAYIARTSSLNEMRDALDDNDAVALYDSALNTYYTKMKTLEGTTNTSFTLRGQPDYFKALFGLYTDGTPDQDVALDYDDAMDAYETEKNSHMLKTSTAVLNWTGTYTGGVVAENYTTSVSGTLSKTYNWIDKGTASVTINSIANAKADIDFQFVLENHGTYDLHSSAYDAMFYTKRDGSDIKGIVGAAQFSEDNGSKTLFDYSVHR